jgi:hypothetical protein
MNSEVPKVLECVETIDVLEADVPEPHSLQPWHFGEEIEVLANEAVARMPEYPFDPLSPNPRDAVF